MWVICVRERGKPLIKNKTGKKRHKSCKVTSRKASDLATISYLL